MAIKAEYLYTMFGHKTLFGCGRGGGERERDRIRAMRSSFHNLQLILIDSTFTIVPRGTS